MLINFFTRSLHTQAVAVVFDGTLAFDFVGNLEVGNHRLERFYQQISRHKRDVFENFNLTYTISLPTRDDMISNNWSQKVCIFSRKQNIAPANEILRYLLYNDTSVSNTKLHNRPLKEQFSTFTDSTS